MTTEREALERAFRMIWPEPYRPRRNVDKSGWQEWVDHYNRFWAMLQANAYLSAAEMLVPEGAWWWVEREAMGEGYHAGCGDDGVTVGSSAALALTNAILKARGLSDEQ